MAETPDRLYERVLVLRCQAGDAAAFAELVQWYQGPLHYFLRKMLRDTERTEDLLQNVWLSVFRSLPRLADPGAFRAWLYRVARDQAAAEMRKLNRPMCALVDQEVPETVDEPNELVVEDVALIHAALDELQPEHREVIVLRYLEDMSYEEIARVVNCQLGTVRSRLYYAKLQLRRLLQRKVSHD